MKRLARLAGFAGVALVCACADDILPTASAPVDPPSLSVTRTPETGEIAAFVPGQIVVRFADASRADELAEKYGGRIEEEMLLPRTMIVEVAEGSEAATVKSLADEPGVEFAELNYLSLVIPCEVGACEAPNDNFRRLKWDLDNTGAILSATGTILGLTGLVDADIDWAELYDALGPGFAGSAVIGIIDTGILATHEDLSGRVLAAMNFASGYASNFVTDRIGHGTHVAGIAAARTNNTVGVNGVAYGTNIRLVNAKACELYLFPDGVVRSSCPNASITNAIVWATDQGAKVLNLSLGGSPFATSGSPAMQAALQYARSRGVLPFCAAGNDANPADPAARAFYAANANTAFPARFPECVTVGATNWGDQRAAYSNYNLVAPGQIGDMALSAPGGEGNPLGTPYGLIASTYIGAAGVNNAYVYLAGTSMATPQAAGLAAMLYATGMTDDDAVLARLQATADDIGPSGYDGQFGYGRINAYRAITGQNPNAPPVAIAGGPYAGVEGSPVQFDASASRDPNNHPLSFDWIWGDGQSLLANGPTPTHTYADNATPAAAGYLVTLTVRDESLLSTTTITRAHIANLPPAVSVALDRTSILSGATIKLTGTFSDPGVQDAPWDWTANWGNGTETGRLLEQSATIEIERRYCAVGSYSVVLSVEDKDGGVGQAGGAVAVSANIMSIDMPNSIIDKLATSGKLPVHVFSSPAFDVSMIDIETATLGNGAATVPVARRPNGSAHAALENGQLVLHFERAELSRSGALNGATSLTLFAALKDGCTQIAGTAPIRVKDKEVADRE